MTQLLERLKKKLEQIEFSAKILAQESKQEQKKSILRSAAVVCATCSGVAMNRNLVPVSMFDSVIIEEAAKVLESECIYAFSKNLKRLVLVGDDQQMRSLVHEKKLKSFSDFDQSLLARLQRLGVPSIQLDQQTRARSSIADLYRWRYTNLRDHWTSHNIQEISNLPSSALAIHVKGNKSKGESNSAECSRILLFLEQLSAAGVKNEDITILSPYKKQKEFIRKRVSSRIQVCTVDEYQGKENDVVLVSMAFSGSRPSAFLCDERRVNVLTSRSKKLFVLFANLSALAQSPVWEPILTKLHQI
uniref:DNA2/NAM7 helicase-like C-terminal domain-containing protein n=1 Tax=Vannella robusta TaxID=1487602 RepID=A0A7S4IQG3_9EUKA|mmetsp:Transcript_6796/g.8451  ORF Transcript_6796/g.8451 Transcript_6796/m.8451 type:complete len:303 (+) Transcript_6796:2-910(+)